MFLNLLLFLFVIPGIVSVIPVQTDNCAEMQRAFDNFVPAADRCIFVSMDQIDCPLVPDHFVVYSITLDEMFSGMVLRYQRVFQCDRVMGFFENFNTYRYVVRNKDLQMAFLPYTKLVIFTLQQDDVDTVLDNEVHQRNILQNGLFMNFAKILNSTHYMVEDVLTHEIAIFSEVKQINATYLEQRRQSVYHPLLYRTKETFNVSLFHCPPHVIKLDDRMTMDSYDGAEFRLLKEISRDWKVNIFDRTFLFDKADTWETVANDVETRRTNMGMCSMWMIHEKYRRLDLSDFFSRICGTFLVPKPLPITHASYIYLPLSAQLWWGIGGTFMFTLLLYFALYRHLVAKDRHESVFESFSRTFVDIVSVATSHGIPQIVRKIPIRVLLMGWILLSLLLGLGYSTKYTSILTKPLYTKAVDTVQEFLDEGLFWGEVGDRQNWKIQYLESGNPVLEQLPSKMIEEKTLADRLEYIPTGKYARYVKVLNNNYVTDTETFSSVAHHLRLMKTCIDNHFTVLSLNKNSPYRRHINKLLGYLREGGIVTHWFNLMRMKSGQSYMPGLFDKNNVKMQMEGSSLAFSNVVGAFYLLAIGLSMSFVVFLLECYIYKKNKSREAKISMEQKDQTTTHR